MLTENRVHICANPAISPFDLTTRKPKILAVQSCPFLINIRSMKKRKKLSKPNIDELPRETKNLTNKAPVRRHITSMLSELVVSCAKVLPELVEFPQTGQYSAVGSRAFPQVPQYDVVLISLTFALINRFVVILHSQLYKTGCLYSKDLIF